MSAIATSTVHEVDHEVLMRFMRSAQRLHEVSGACRSEWTPRRAARLQAPGLEGVSSKDINTAAHFMKYAFAAYGYMLYIWSEPRYR